jgi:hypothetical protein
VVLLALKFGAVAKPLESDVTVAVLGDPVVANAPLAPEAGAVKTTDNPGLGVEKLLSRTARTEIWVGNVVPTGAHSVWTLLADSAYRRSA